MSDKNGRNLYKEYHKQIEKNSKKNVQTITNMSYDGTKTFSESKSLYDTQKRDSFAHQSQ